MRPSLRFLALAVVGWAGVRAATLGAIPGADMFSIEQSEAKSAPSVIATQFPEIEPLQPAIPGYGEIAMQPAAVPMYTSGTVMPRPVGVPVYYYSAAAVPSAPQPAPPLTPIVPSPRPQFYSRIPQLDEWPLSRIASAAYPSRASTGGLQSAAPAYAAKPGIDRVQLTTWALLRGRQQLVTGPQALSTHGTLGGSQAGARLTYNFSPAIAATLRTSSEVGRRGGEVAAGVRVKPLQSVPVWVTAERRQAIGRLGGGRNAFAVFAEGGVYQRPMPWNFHLDLYAQAGVVDFRSRDLFADGSATFTRPLYKQFSAGLGVWGGVQPGLYRVDAGPRLTMKVRNNMRVHLDWRQRLAGNARPGSGPAITLAGDF